MYLAAAGVLTALAFTVIVWGVRSLRRQPADAKDTDDPATWRKLSAVARIRTWLDERETESGPRF